MPTQLPPRDFCSKLFFISESLYRESRVPSGAMPALSPAEVHECDTLVTHALDNLATADLLSLLTRTFHLAAPIDFIHRLAGINQDVLAADPHATHYWLRVANTYSMLFVLQVVQERCRRVEMQAEFDDAVGCYENAVEYAERIDDELEESDLVVEVDRWLVRCRVVVERLLLSPAAARSRRIEQCEV